MYKKRIYIIIILVIISLCTSCGAKDATEEKGYFETENFRYIEWDFFFGNSVTIVGLTEKGMDLEVVVIPEVNSLGYTVGKNYFDSDKLKKIYIPTTISSINGEFLTGKNVDVIYLSIEPYYFPNTDEAIWGEGTMYAPASYADRFPDAKPANVSFMYNYENAPNGGYAWIDNINAGEKIEIDPPAHFIREGYYHYGGWYTEPECINKWDIENGIPFPIIEDTEEETIEEETGDKELILYTKWG